MRDHTAFGIALSFGTATLCWTTDDGKPTVPETVNLLGGHPRGVARELADMLDVRRREADALGVSIGGHVTAASDRVAFASQLVTADEDWVDVPLASILGDAIGISNVHVENDVNCMVEYERSWGVARDLQSFAVVYLAPEIAGLGCGLCIDGVILTGANGGTGEIGHLVVQPGGPRCRCGNRGCLQAMLSAENLAREVNWGKRGQHQTLGEIRSLVNAGDVLAHRTFERAGKVLGVALANLINLVDPGNIILGGAAELLRGEDDVFMRAMHTSLERYSFSNLGVSTSILEEALDVGVAAQGAATLAYRRLTQLPPN